ncbi:DUF2141 domain-containing protein [Aquimarina brevivitae]|uniref:Uncharacterized protein (DUF2141 family) n=1 Tax=Aquimarina brevivitae TaxID=323412 RepID=A0A4Q7P0M5_9FLAO|nr:DUF2141 domain-containing protein [Aquimarina brevivitae]RZS93346.1 uncharacterized protein (DUF2141 family) [Aquimarina brevivitae]
MKKSILLIALTAIGTLSTLKAQDTSSLTVTITNIKTQEGVIRIGLYNDEATYLKKIVQSKKPEANATSVTVTFNDLPKGDYGISLYHDEDRNGELNTNFIGIPSEPYAFSNNATGMFGPAKWEDVKFTVGDTPTVQSITL